MHDQQAKVIGDHYFKIECQMVQSSLSIIGIVILNEWTHFNKSIEAFN